MTSDIKPRINAAVKEAMRAQAKDRLGVLRLITAEFKKIEVDERNSVSQFTAGGRQELADKETFEISVIQEFLPQSLSEDELVTLIKEAIAETGAASAQDMGKLMAIIKPKAQGRCDMSQVSLLIKAQFA
jgi:uncharacterized protein